jgi:hypothetical protein
VPEDLSREFPERYVPLVEYISTTFPEQTIAFKLACQLIENRRLHAGRNLRRTLQRYWTKTNEHLKIVCPIEIVYSFEPYVEAIFRAAGEICGLLFHDPESYSAFLNVVQHWILDAILPKLETCKQSEEKQISAMEWLLPIAERMDAIDPQTNFPASYLAATIYEARLNLKNYDFIPDVMLEAYRQDRIIDIRENFSAFADRCDWESDGFLWGGDWEHVLDESLVDVMKRKGESFEGVCSAQATLRLLRKTKNREEAQNIWTAALDKLNAILLSGWRNVSPQSPAAVVQADTTKALADRRSKWLNEKLAGNHSDVDLAGTGKISYNTISRYRSGLSILPRTRRGLSDALKEFGIRCEFAEVPE